MAYVSDTTRLQVEVQVSEADVNFIENGSKVNVYISSLSSQPFAGTVISVDRMAGPMNRKFTVRVGLDKPELQMRPGMFAEVVLATEEAENTLCVPIEAVIARGEKSVVIPWMPKTGPVPSR